MAWWQGALLIIYSCALGLLMLLSLHRYILIRLYYRNKGKLPIPVGEFGDLPRVTIQLPVYNEVYVVERLIRAAAAIDYPNELLEIQVLDDSTDETTEVAQRCVTELRASGIDIVHIHRRDRTGFKAGALEAGLKVASGAYVALFDADFVPPRDFLNRTLPHFTDGSVGMVQVRWGHLNRDYSMLTRVQAILLDGHFVIEHGARSRSGMFFNFNGTAGVWRRTCIADAGGWQHDTLTEDLDLSYRAQLRGWRFVFLEDVVSPAEIPVEMNAWKSQQFRWAKGSIQAARKLLARVLTGRMPWRVKLEATVQLSSNLVYIFMALVALLIYPAVLSRQTFGWQRIFIVDLPLFLAATGVVSRFYIHSQKELYADWVGRLKYIPLVLALGMGISLNNAKAVLEALVGYRTEFRRTPKYRVVERSDTWVGKRYSVRKNILSFLELGMGVYLVWVTIFALTSGIYFPVPFLGLFSFGFLYVGGMSLLQTRFGRIRSWAPEIAPEAAAD